MCFLQGNTNTALIKAVKDGDLEKIKKCIAHGVDANCVEVRIV